MGDRGRGGPRNEKGPLNGRLRQGRSHLAQSPGPVQRTQETVDTASQREGRVPQEVPDIRREQRDKDRGHRKAVGSRFKWLGNSGDAGARGRYGHQGLHLCGIKHLFCVGHWDSGADRTG